MDSAVIRISRWILTLGLVGAIAFLGGCKAVKDMLAGMDKPTASIVSARLAGLSLDGVTIVMDVDVNNPYTVPLPLVNLDYALASGGAEFLKGAADVQGSVPAKGIRRLEVPATVKFAGLLSTVKGVKLGAVVPYEASLGLSVDAPAAGRLTLPLKTQGQVPIPNVPKVSLASVQWKSLTLSSAEAVLNLGIENTNEFPLDLSSMKYDLTLGNTPIINTSLAKTARLEKGGSGQLAIPISIKPSNLGVAAFNMLTGSGAGYRIHGAMDVGTPFGALTLPFDQSGNTEFKK